MQSFITLVTLVITILAALLTPTSAQPSIYRRGLPGAYYTCVSENFAGPDGCGWTSPTERCRAQGGSGIKSLGPDPGTICSLFRSFDCTGSAIKSISFPGLGSGLPNFGSFSCKMDGKAQAKAANVKEKALDPGLLSGGVGSADRREHAEEIRAMEEDGFSEGLIGLKKDMYY
ncbi:hypothetical protein T440DRAFT_16521 [Plenodomus tracheiphilus IPT5]|uniref:Uncharacterized protein n=1 Tax=Plenodomus tracheiphilus IPT5 TaxID=1408161 RepID=A0A6A7BNT8_9PLEO|nr:hypothetical protein T440DRAFT_16521 [Plenodomus tracheiphilus IPT5]